MCMKFGLPAALALAVVTMLLPRSAESGDPQTAPSANEVQAVLDKAINYLKSSQGQDGSFSPKIAGPGITTLVVAGLARNGVGTKFLANYTTSVAIMAFKEANRGGKYDAVIKSAGDFLKRIQHATDPQDTAFGGFSYDGKKRPDMSNSAFSVEALIAAGIPKDDPAIQKALTFLGRCQNLPGEFNDQPFARKTTKDDQGGFVYSPFDKDEKIHKTPEGGLR